MTEHSTIDRLALTPPDKFSPEDLNAAALKITATPRAEIRLAVDLESRRKLQPIILAGVTTVVAGAVVAALVLSSSRAGVAHHADRSASRVAQPPARTGSAIKARLLSAIDATSDEVIETHTVISDGQVINEWANGNNTQSVTYDSGYGIEPAQNSLAVVGPSGTTVTIIYPSTKTWTVIPPDPSNPNHPIAPPSLRDQIAAGVLTVVGTHVAVDGHDTIEVTDAKSGPNSGVSHLWIDSTKYLPIRQTLVPAPGVSGDSSQTDWTYFSYDSAAKNLELPVPASYTQVSSPPTTVAPQG